MCSRTKAVSTGPIEEVCLTPDQIFAIVPKRPHRVTNIGDTSTNFIVL
jgi:mannose-6-phosphate isomerase-like protein (cupin superfamily)